MVLKLFTCVAKIFQSGLRSDERIEYVLGLPAEAFFDQV